MGLEPTTFTLATCLPIPTNVCSDNDLATSPTTTDSKNDSAQNAKIALNTDSASVELGETELASVMAAWATLPEAIRTRILGLVEGATAAGAGS